MQLLHQMQRVPGLVWWVIGILIFDVLVYWWLFATAKSDVELGISESTGFDNPESPISGYWWGPEEDRPTTLAK